MSQKLYKQSKKISKIIIIIVQIKYQAQNQILTNIYIQIKKPNLDI